MGGLLGFLLQFALVLLFIAIAARIPMLRGLVFGPLAVSTPA